MLSLCALPRGPSWLTMAEHVRFVTEDVTFSSADYPMPGHDITFAGTSEPVSTATQWIKGTKNIAHQCSSTVMLLQAAVGRRRGSRRRQKRCLNLSSVGRSNGYRVRLRLAGETQMKRTTVWIFALSAALLLGGCWPYWHDGGHGRDHGRGYDGDRGGQEYRR